MEEFEIVEQLRMGLRQRLLSQSHRFKLDESSSEEVMLQTLVADLYSSKSCDDAWNVLQIATGQLPSYRQVNELQIFSCIALNPSELFKRLLENMVVARGIAGLAPNTRLITGKNVVVIESSHLLSLNSGIQRVARTIAKSFVQNSSFVLLASMADGSGFTELNEAELDHLLQESYASPDKDLVPNGSPKFNVLLENCQILIPEVSKNKDFSSRLRALGAYSSNNTFFIGYDLIPILAPEYVAPIEIETFSHYLLATTESNAVICISNQTRNEFAGYFRARESVKSYLGKVETLTLPTDRPSLNGERKQKPAEAAELEKDGYFLCVGTIEPRKNQLKVAAAFNELWARGGKQKIVYVGRISDLVKSEFAKLTHNHLGTQVFHYEDLSDAELDWLYRNSTATIQVSNYEGFGLPIVESILHGKPVIVNAFGVQNELSNGRGGFAVPDQSVKSLAESIDSLSTNKSLISQLIEETSQAQLMSSNDYAQGLEEILRT